MHSEYKRPGHHQRKAVPALLAAGSCTVASAYQTAATAASGAAARINDPAAGWDHLWHEVIVDITIIGVLFALVMAWFLYQYRAKKPGEVGRQPKLSPAAVIGWAVIPTFVFMADDFYLAANGWKLWNDYRDVPADRMEVKLESGMYSWDYTYDNGVKTQNVLRVPAGKPVVLRMTSRDTLHSHFIPDFRVKEDSMPGRVTYLWFYPKEPGEHIVSCAEYCGVMHSYMAGKVIVMAPAEFKTWLDQEHAKLTPADKPAEKSADGAAEKAPDQAPAKAG
ncbi:MAG TPA: cytochrome c oxidase subunit II [Burkholderiaceae bacterium]|nr:cytochrome c oxidase subunit II [Burkholderiaceae bacterium]